MTYVIHMSSTCHLKVDTSSTHCLWYSLYILSSTTQFPHILYTNTHCQCHVDVVRTCTHDTQIWLVNLPHTWQVQRMMCQHPSHLHTTCRWRVDDIWMTYVICHPKSPTKSHSCVIRTSSTCHLHIICMSSVCRLHETPVPKLFQVKQQNTALLRTSTMQDLVRLYMKTRMHSSRMHTGHFSDRLSCTHPPIMHAPHHACSPSCMPPVMNASCHTCPVPYMRPVMYTPCHATLPLHACHLPHMPPAMYTPWTKSQTGVKTLPSHNFVRNKQVWVGEGGGGPGVPVWWGPGLYRQTELPNWKTLPSCNFLGRW